METFFNNLADLLDMEAAELTMESYLTDLEAWDSLSIVSFAAMADIKYKKQLKATEVKAAQTVADLFALVTGE